MAQPEQIGRYLLFDAIARGGMASVHLGRAEGDAGFSKIVAIKRHHPQFAKDPYFRDMLLDEARLTARIVHPNVISVLDAVAAGGELLVVMEYVPALSFSELGSVWTSSGEHVPAPIAVAVLVSALEGLHAAHEATDERGAPLQLVHRDVSPHNLLVGADGMVRVIDFGVALAAQRVHVTRTGEIKGKLAYMAHEQIRRLDVDRRADIYGAGVTLWEALSGRRIHDGVEPGEVVRRVAAADYEAPSRFSPAPVPALDEVVLRALRVEQSERFATAQEMARALRERCAPASRAEVADWVERVGHEALQARARARAAVEGWEVGQASPKPGQKSAATDPTEARVLPSGVATETRPGPVVLTDETGSTRTTQLHRDPDDTRTTQVTDPDGTRTTQKRQSDDAARIRGLAGPGDETEPTRSRPDRAAVSTSASAAASAVLPTSSLWSGVLGAAGAVALIAVVALIILYARTPADSTVPAAPSAVSPTSVVSPTEVPPSTGSGVTADAPPIVTATAVASTETVSAPPLPSAATPPGPKRPPTTRPPKPKANCTPPYTLDKDGVRIPKRECF
jgi:serine/threonine-protein kinase